MLRAAARRYLTPTSRQAARTLWNETVLYPAIHRGGVRRAKEFRGRRELRLNLGCGPNLKAGWINIDLRSTAGIRLDLRRPLPFDDGSVSEIYSEHFLEHLAYPREVMGLLAECLRVLRPGGQFRVGVPDSGWAVRAYATGDESYFGAVRERGWHPDWCRTPMEHINYHVRFGGAHQWTYDQETLAQVLMDAGFTGITRRDPDPGLDSPKHRLGTLYIDARKPASEAPTSAGVESPGVAKRELVAV